MWNRYGVGADNDRRSVWINTVIAQLLYRSYGELPRRLHRDADEQGCRGARPVRSAIAESGLAIGTGKINET